jgi:DNA polymerase V
MQFPVATSGARQLIAAARAGVEQLFVQGYRYAKAVIMLLDIVAHGYEQQSLFDDVQILRRVGRSCRA